MVIVMVIYRNDKAKIGKVSIIALILGLLVCFELKLLGYETNTYNATFHADPIELFDGTGVHMMVVTTRSIGYLKDREQIIKGYEHEEDIELIDLYQLDNKDRYQSKNTELLNMMGIKKDDFAVMGENVKSYLGEETKIMKTFLSRTDLSGDSAGLGLALSGLIEKGELKNHVTFGVTGALSATGEVLPIGMIKEKLLIAEEKGYPFMIIPSGNRTEAKKVIVEENLEIEVFDVNHIDESIVLINEWNAGNGE
ncbi:MAG: S16 family serine protease [Paenisporosarcina sp.]